jgi:hypothetical protein
MAPELFLLAFGFILSIVGMLAAAPQADESAPYAAR